MPETLKAPVCHAYGMRWKSRVLNSVAIGGEVFRGRQAHTRTTCMLVAVCRFHEESPEGADGQKGCLFKALSREEAPWVRGRLRFGLWARTGRKARSSRCDAPSSFFVLPIPPECVYGVLLRRQTIRQNCPAAACLRSAFSASCLKLLRRR